jgi:dTDP-4-dehydrorhamnose 3,5-epimerase
MAFTRIDTQLDGPVLLEPDVFADERGFFAETFRESWLAEHGITDQWVQDNHSRSTRGTIRGLHFQIGDGVAKLVRCGRGRIVDVLVDLRRSSPGYGRWEAYELDDEGLRVLYVPVGFAHGFAVLSDVADVLYKQTAYYSGDVERGIAYDDASVGVSWPVPSGLRVVSERDRTAPTLAEFGPQLPDW